MDDRKRQEGSKWQSTDRAQRIESLIFGHLQRRFMGEEVPDEALIAAHQDLLPELAEELELLRGTGSMLQRTSGSADEPTPRSSKALTIRCPHCHHPVEILADTPFGNITCSACGSQFSLVGAETETVTARKIRKLSQFELLEPLGEGRFGIVWKARDTELDRTVAIKIPRQGQLEPRQIDQFLREARTAAQLTHPNIIRVYEVGRDGDTLYIVSDLVQGVSLADRLAGHRFTAREAARICLKIADALDHAHQAGVIHRDLKPQNVMLTSSARGREISSGSDPIDAEYDEPVIMDFGLARRDSGEVTMTTDGTVLGTPAYMSPEQAAGEAHHADRRSDIYSLSVMLFELLTGERPFRGNTRMLIHQVIHDEAPSPRKLNAAVPVDLETLCLKGLEKDPTKRYASAREVADELQRFLDGVPIQARPISAPQRVWRWCRRKPLAAALVGLIVFLAVAGPIVAVIQTSQSRQLREARDFERERSAALALDRGLTLCEQGQVAHGMVWLAHTLELLPESDLVRRRVIRENLAAWRQKLHPLQKVFRHTRGQVICATFTPDGQKVITGGSDWILRVWNADTGDLIHQWTGHRNDIHDVAVSPDGTLIASASIDKTAVVWDLTTGQHQTIVHDTAVYAVAFSPDGTFLVTGAEDMARLWDLDMLAHPVRQYASGSELFIHDIAFSADGEQIVVASTAEDSAMVWNVQTGRRGPTIRIAPAVYCGAAAFGAAGQIATGDWQKATLWDPATRKPLMDFLHQGSVHALAFSPDGTRLATASYDNTARVWDVHTGEPIGCPMKHQGPVETVAFSPQGDCLLTGSDDGLARLWRIEDAWQPVQVIPAGMSSVSFGQSDAIVLLGGPSGAELWDLDQGEQIMPFADGSGTVAQLRHDQIRRDGKWVLTTSARHWAKLWRLPDGQLREFRHDNRVNDAVFDPRRPRILTACWDQFAYLWDMNDSTKPVDRIRHESRVNSIAIDPTGSFVVTGTFSGHIRLWKGEDFKPLGAAFRHQGAVWSIAFDHNGRRFVTGSMDNTAIIWDRATLQPIGKRLLHHGPIYSVAFAPDNRHVATASFDGTARLWDADSGMPIGPPFIHYTQPSDPPDDYQPEPQTVPMLAADFNPSGTRLAVAGQDGRTRLWDCQIRAADGADDQVMAWVESITRLRVGPNETVQPVDSAVARSK